MTRGLVTATSTGFVIGLYATAQDLVGLYPVGN